MKLLSEVEVANFARPKGAKDKGKRRARRLGQVALGAAGLAAVGLGGKEVLRRKGLRKEIDSIRDLSKSIIDTDPVRGANTLRDVDVIVNRDYRNSVLGKAIESGGQRDRAAKKALADKTKQALNSTANKVLGAGKDAAGKGGALVVAGGNKAQSAFNNFMNTKITPVVQKGLDREYAAADKLRDTVKTQVSKGKARDQKAKAYLRRKRKETLGFNQHEEQLSTFGAKKWD